MPADLDIAYPPWHCEYHLHYHGLSHGAKHVQPFVFFLTMLLLEAEGHCVLCSLLLCHLSPPASQRVVLPSLHQALSKLFSLPHYVPSYHLSGGKASISMAAGDLLIINTPGAGGCGRPHSNQGGSNACDMGAPDGMPNARSGEQGAGGVVRGRELGEEDSQLQRALQSKRQRTGREEDGQSRVVLKGSVQEYVASQEGA
eukprot:1141849-Pelagomonas_calceolata.AAC.4